MASALRGGRRRRRLGSRLVVLVALLAGPAMVAAAGYVALRDDGAGGPSRDAAAAANPRSPLSSPDPDELASTPPVTDVPLNGVDSFHLRMRKPPRSALVFDVDTGEVLFRHRPTARLPIASLTKVMTALIATERGRPEEPVRITRAALSYRGSGIGLLPRGKRVRFETLLNGMLLVSGNDASIALAVHVAGSQRHFTRLMNQRGRTLGLTCTRFADAHGLSPGNRSCARDLAVMTRLAMANPRIARVVRRREAAFRFPIKGRRLFLSGHNPLIRAGYRGAIGLKTGYTVRAGRCFIGVARRGGRTLAVVLLNSPNTLKHSARLLDEGFRHG